MERSKQPSPETIAVIANHLFSVLDMLNRADKHLQSVLDRDLLGIDEDQLSSVRRAIDVARGRCQPQYHAWYERKRASADERKQRHDAAADRRQGRWFYLLGRHWWDALRCRHRAQGAQPQGPNLPVRLHGLGHL